jgi:hypothetical protein
MMGIVDYEVIDFGFDRSNANPAGITVGVEVGTTW